MIVVVDYGVGNLGSVANMLRKIKVDAVVSGDPAVIDSADKLILPGVGAFDNAMRNLEDRQLIPTLTRKVVDEHTPILGLCVGMQLFSRGSEEGRLPGLGWIPADTVRFRLDPAERTLKVPHMGWSEVIVQRYHPIWNGLSSSQPRFYFVHSYHVVCDNAADVLAVAHHGYDFAAAVAHDNILGTQWHPEKSHIFGMKLLHGFANL